MVKKTKKSKGSKKRFTVLIAIILIGITIFYFYSAEQGKMRGYNFGNDLQIIQEELKNEQSSFYSNVRMWEENSITKSEILKLSETHIKNMNGIISKYDTLQIPDTFSGAVKLFKLSTESQLESDIHLINWIEFEDESEKIRSNEILQQSFEYELAGLTSYNNAKNPNP
ncbi:MAG TPA: hypothetical protein QF710_02190 [Candidatus Nitrosopelagicus sp.]|nr:hypothetical protein [Candidatus Nitrosopelagicus sp.]